MHWKRLTPNAGREDLTSDPLSALDPSLNQSLGYARTVRIRAAHKPESRFDADAYYSYIAEGGPIPSVSIIEDVDDTPGYGAHWGEVNTNIHYGLGCLGVVTNGSVRDIPDRSASTFRC